MAHLYLDPQMWSCQPWTGLMGVFLEAWPVWYTTIYIIWNLLKIEACFLIHPSLLVKFGGETVKVL